MFSIHASTVLTAITQNLLEPYLQEQVKPTIEPFVVGKPRKMVSTRTGILFTLDCELAHYTEEKSYSERTLVYILVCPQYHVWVAIPTPERDWLGPFMEEIPLDAWENTSNHDSCWRSDGIDSPLTQLYFKFAEKLNEQLVKDGLQKIRPIDMRDHTHFGLFRPWKFVNVTYSHESNTYKYNLEKVEVKA